MLNHIAQRRLQQLLLPGEEMTTLGVTWPQKLARGQLSPLMHDALAGRAALAAGRGHASGGTPEHPPPPACRPWHPPRRGIPLGGEGAMGLSKAKGAAGEEQRCRDTHEGSGQTPPPGPGAARKQLPGCGGALAAAGLGRLGAGTPPEQGAEPGRSPPGAALGAGPAAEPGRREPYANQGSTR